jgi:DNA-binding HxlR family transcriptional regulator
MEVRKEGKEKLFLEEDWRTLSTDEAFRVAEALSDSLRQWIYMELEKGPVRQSELAKRASEVFGKKITNPLLRYHISQLEEAGLVASEIVPSPPRGAKIIRKNYEVRIQLRQFAGRARADLEDELKGLFERWRKSSG